MSLAIKSTFKSEEKAASVAENRFGLPMREWQRDCAKLARGKRFVVLALHRRAGKTELALKRLLTAAMLNDKELAVFLYVAPFQKQARQIAWTRLKVMAAPFINIGQMIVNETEGSITCAHNGAVIRVGGGDLPHALRGLRTDGIVIDETAQIKPEVWEEVLLPTTSDRKAWVWFLGTPHGINLFSQLFYSADDKDDWARARYTVYDTDAIDPDEIAKLRDSMNETTFAREYLCDFAASADDQLLSLTDVEAASQRSHRPRAMDYAPRIIGVDPARFGDDRSVIVKRQGLQMFEPIVLRNLNNMELAGLIAEEIDQWQPDAVFIDAGGGAGEIDRLRQLNYSVIEVNFGGKANDPRFVNKRTEMWWLMADAIKSSLAIPNVLDLKIEIATPTYKYDAANRIKLESKDEIRKRLPNSGSPDIADALALTYAQPVKKKADQSAVKPMKEYDPYAVRL